MTRRGMLLAVIGCALMAPMALAQERRNFDPAQFREQRMNRIKEQLGSNEDEWKVLAPKVEKVITAQFAGFGGGGRRGGGATADTATPQTPVAKAASELRTLLENKEAPADDIKAKLTALREARDKVKADVQAAQKELKELLTQRQEAILVTNNVLE